MSNFEIVEAVKKLNIPNFTGVFMRDEILNRTPSKNECFVYNIDSSKGHGTHWTSVYIKNGKCFYFDSFGFPPPLEIIQYTKNLRNREYNTFEIQARNEVICGQYCLYVLYRMSLGVPFYTILDELYYFSIIK